jgi:hypothetical protein
MNLNELQAGDLVSVVADDGRMGVVKILATDAEGVHIRLYQERFDTRPLSVDLEMLTLGSMLAPPGEPFSIGHIPLRFGSFASWQPTLIASGGTVGEDELAGYRSWEEAEGGYF